MIADDHPSGAIDPVHRHFAHAFVCVLEGTIVMQVKGGQQVTLTRGQTFYEGPRDLHTVGHNASQAEPAVHRALFEGHGRAGSRPIKVSGLRAPPLALSIHSSVGKAP
jgi:hypothetical protein